MTQPDNLPLKIRVSLASAILLGLTEGISSAKPTTIYLLTYRSGRCHANCSFCAQAESSTTSADKLSRVIWPEFPFRKVMSTMKKAEMMSIQRVCIQAMNYPDVFDEIFAMINAIHSEIKIPISISCQPLSTDQIKKLKEVGMDRIGIPLDVPTKPLFEQIKGTMVGGPYIWEKSIEALRMAVQILGKGKVSTHFIVGLGESDKELMNTIQEIVDMGVYPALFAFTPLSGTREEHRVQPSLERYRCIQLTRYLVVTGKLRFENIFFNEHGRIRGFDLNQDIIRKTVKSGIPFKTSGCPGCNRPFYNERAGGPFYNYPWRLRETEINEVSSSIWRYLNG